MYKGIRNITDLNHIIAQKENRKPFHLAQDSTRVVLRRLFVSCILFLSPLQSQCVILSPSLSPSSCAALVSVEKRFSISRERKSLL